ncbi:uncharacterized protein [Elaeis guineensis]|uniref:uncharacterized protein n=1 Tax=Elaeis guineensis var. tenera TaxID=51953 RepID=UPI003C6DB67B
MASAAMAPTSMAMPSPCINITEKRAFLGSNAFHATRSSPKATIGFRRSHCGLAVRASSSSPAKEKAVAGLTAAALAAAMVIPEVAEAAQPGISPSLKNFLLSIVAGGVVLAVLVGAVIAVANFDPVKRT